ncbi:hypothetical protein TWF694_000356 [Orbilia ellipsospora]|uniref:Uncharacterized protein n=1 Tax=Orbilia ellipsospora TaxID=2528407 RepID=A0AAV9XQX2_9PEZI
MCFEYTYNACGIHHYRVSLIPPDFCRCDHVIQLFNYESRCDICGQPQSKLGKRFNNTHLKPEESDITTEMQQSRSPKKPPWVIDVRGILKGYPKPEEILPAEEEEEEEVDLQEVDTSVSRFGMKKRKCQWIIDVRGKLKGHPKEPRGITPQPTMLRSDGKQTAFEKADIRPNPDERPEAEKKQGEGKKEPKWDIDPSGQPKEYDEAEARFKKSKPSRGLWKEYY